VNSITRLAIIYCIVQIADGALTYCGIIKHGINAEGNPLVKWVLVALGVIPGLISIKALSLVIIYFLCAKQNGGRLLKMTLIISIVFYLIFAIVPWILVLILT